MTILKGYQPKREPRVVRNAFPWPKSQAQAWLQIYEDDRPIFKLFADNAVNGQLK